jgi:hypothetical protein
LAALLLCVLPALAEPVPERAPRRERSDLVEWGEDALIEVEATAEEAAERAAAARPAAARVRVEVGAAETDPALTPSETRALAERVFQPQPALPELSTPVQRAQARNQLRAGLETRLTEYREFFSHLRSDDLAYRDLQEFREGLEP